MHIEFSSGTVLVSHIGHGRGRPAGTGTADFQASKQVFNIAAMLTVQYNKTGTLCSCWHNHQLEPGLQEKNIGANQRNSGHADKRLSKRTTSNRNINTAANKNMNVVIRDSYDCNDLATFVTSEHAACRFELNDTSCQSRCLNNYDKFRCHFLIPPGSSRCKTFDSTVFV